MKWINEMVEEENNRLIQHYNEEYLRRQLLEQMVAENNHGHTFNYNNLCVTCGISLIDYHMETKKMICSAGREK